MLRICEYVLKNNMTQSNVNSPEYHPVHIPATKSLEASVGNTPLVRLRHVTHELPKSFDLGELNELIPINASFSLSHLPQPK